MTGDERLKIFLAERPRLLRLAYRYLGTVSDAEDMVQEAWLRFAEADQPTSAPAFLSTIVTRLSLDRLKSAARRRETYVGPWLPEPLVGQTEPPGDTTLDISFAVMRALEALTPEERAAFFLHDLFELPFGEIAATLGKTPAACRKLAERARGHLAGTRRRFSPDAEQIARFSAAFAAAIQSGDESSLRALLAEDVEFVSDGGGKVAAALNVIHGRAAVLAFLTGIGRKNLAAHTVVPVRAIINGTNGFMVHVDGALDQTFVFDMDETGAIATFYLVRNPEKLGHARKFAGN